jgi:hypothetical protein
MFVAGEIAILCPIPRRNVKSKKSQKLFEVCGGQQMLHMTLLSI